MGGNENRSSNTFSVRTYGELEAVLKDEKVEAGSGLRIIEVFMKREDVQGALLCLMEKQIAEENS